MEKVLVGLSGGVDSTAVALLLKEQGFEVHGVYLSFCGEGGEDRARYAAEKLEIPFTVAKRERRFANRVIKPFTSAYEQGSTPNPCVECNRSMKFACLLEEADKLGIEKVATGHYATVRRSPDGRMQLCRSADRNKDQSYFLWKLTQKQLSRVMFPLARAEKQDVKERAKAYVSPEEKALQLRTGEFCGCSGKGSWAAQGTCALYRGAEKGTWYCHGRAIFCFAASSRAK